MKCANCGHDQEGVPMPTHCLSCGWPLQQQPHSPQARRQMKIVRERMQRIARQIDRQLPKGYGFVVFCFPFNAPPDFRGEYASNGKREDIVRMLQEFITANPMPKPEDN
jgi:hypothetical protein